MRSGTVQEVIKRLHHLQEGEGNNSAQGSMFPTLLQDHRAAQGVATEEALVRCKETLNLTTGKKAHQFFMPTL